ncbi:MAG: ribosome biogenesis GTPase YlqF, partial [Clostridia bacterium]|nr:ribosome biogenesis GTPase YlqF [Clostridia bacterium]
MQHLQWFPGHMTAAMRMMEDNLKLVDGVMIVLDARAPRASINKKLDRLFVNKKVLYVLNKTDLVDEK